MESEKLKVNLEEDPQDVKVNLSEDVKVNLSEDPQDVKVNIKFFNLI